MLELLKRIRNALAYTIAGLVILLAVLVGLFRLFLPRLTEYQEDIKAWATAAIGIEVEFTGMDARWRLSGPELNFYDAQLILPGDASSLIEAGEVTIGVGLIRLLTDRTLVVDRLVVADSDFELSQAEDGSLRIQGLTPDELANLVPTSGEAGDVVLEGRDIGVRYTRFGDPEPFEFMFASIEAIRRDELLMLEASLDLDDGFGSRLALSADRLLPQGAGSATWQVYVDGRSLGLTRWSALAPRGIPRLQSGYGDVSLWLEVDADGLSKSTANLAVQEFAIEGAEDAGTFDLDGRFEFSRTDGGVLIAADNASLVTSNGRWPDSSLQLEFSENPDGTLGELRVHASYLQLDDAGYFTPFLPADTAAELRRFAPRGEIRDLRLGLFHRPDSSRRYDLAAEAFDIGLEPVDDFPGVRGLTGSVRADADGGRLELQSAELAIRIPRYLPDAVLLDHAGGTVIWRQSGDRLTVLTDRLDLSGPVFDSRTSLQVTVSGDGSSPVVDLDSHWSIRDVGAAKGLIPAAIMHPRLYEWFQTALVSGRLQNGRTRLAGPLDRFPFDDGGGRFEVTARFEDGEFDYAPQWPAASVRSMDVSLVGMEISTERNVATTLGIRTENAAVRIADLRQPVLEIDASADGLLESMRRFARQSPIARVFGGRLDTVAVGGRASVDLSLIVPIQDRRSFSFDAEIRPQDGSVELAGFPAAVSNLAGVVRISRDAVSSESLTGTFLGEPVDIELASGGDAQPDYGVIVTARGRATTRGLLEGLRAPVSGLLSGATDYEAIVRFPAPGLESPPPVQIAVASDLAGLGLELPPPVEKRPEVPSPMTLAIEFPEAGRITASATLDDDVRWSGDFFRDDYGWDFDRGSLAFGGDYPTVPESRGLHIRGSIDELRLADWLAAARNQRADGPRVIDRIRSIDLFIGDLRLFGQHLADHRVRMDRSGGEWYLSATGEQVEGTATIPYDFAGGRAIVLDMQRLILPGDEEESERASDIATLDPRTLPPISIRAGEFALGERHVGSLSIDLRKTESGLLADSFTAVDDAFTIEGSAGWSIDPAPGSEPESRVTAKLVSSDVEKTLARLNYEPVINSDRLEIDADVFWPGGPGGDFLDHINGVVAVRFGEGQLNDVEPGAGRVFGLMSVVELPRRLALDFRDVFDKGFGFDEITGTFRLDDGNAYTCDLSLKGPAADIGIVGRVGLADGIYDQTAVVSANVGNTLPVVGAVVAGPQVAAALLIFSQIFKKPLQEMGQVYYAIEGALEDPQVEGANAQRFAETSSASQCLAELE